MVAMFTYHDMKRKKLGKTNYQSQGIAYSLDEGLTWTNMKPIQHKNPNIKDFRDLK
jgi:levanase/fructan beta-fructosidase